MFDRKFQLKISKNIVLFFLLFILFELHRRAVLNEDILNPHCAGENNLQHGLFKTNRKWRVIIKTNKNNRRKCYIYDMKICIETNQFIWKKISYHRRSDEISVFYLRYSSFTNLLLFICEHLIFDGQFWIRQAG